MSPHPSQIEQTQIKKHLLYTKFNNPRSKNPNNKAPNYYIFHNKTNSTQNQNLITKIEQPNIKNTIFGYKIEETQTKNPKIQHKIHIPRHRSNA